MKNSYSFCRHRKPERFDAKGWLRCCEQYCLKCMKAIVCIHTKKNKTQKEKITQAVHLVQENLERLQELTGNKHGYFFELKNGKTLLVRIETPMNEITVCRGLEVLK